jgi:hypothetical protein
MASQIEVTAGALSPEAVAIVITTTPDVGTDVTSVSARLERPDGSTRTVTLTPSAPTATTTTVSWVFAADGTDVPTRGVARIRLTLQPSGRRCKAVVLRVKSD